MKIDIYSGFLGAGKTTLIKKMIKEAYNGEKLMLIENEFGQIGIDGGFLKDSGINITEMNSGCICCSLVGDFGKALSEAIETYHPDRIIIEPSGVGKLSDVVRAAEKVVTDEVVLNCRTTVADVNKCKMYMKNFGEFFCDQIKEANCIVLSHTKGASQAKIEECVALLREQNNDAVIVTTDWECLTGKQLLEAMEKNNTLDKTIEEMKHEHHHQHDDGECCEHEHHHHDDDDDGECCEHGHHHHHHADEIFDSCGIESAKKFTEDKIRHILEALADEDKYGIILRAKGIVDSEDGEWIYFDYIPGVIDIRRGNADVIGKICVIGSKINKENIKKLLEA